MIKMYGHENCSDCTNAKEVFASYHIPYEYINVRKVPGAKEEMLKLNGGIMSVPTILFESGKILIEPTKDELKAALNLT